MKSTCVAVIFIGLAVVLDAVVRATETDSDNDMEKRRGWGKRSDPELKASLDRMRQWEKGTALEDPAGDAQKRRGWGKRSDLEEVDKRRGWGKRSDLEDSEVDKRRGWGKRSIDAEDEVNSQKRRGWGKRADNSEGLVQKRRGWGKRGWIQQEPAGLYYRNYARRYGWGKRSSQSAEVSCDQLKNDVYMYVYQAVQAENKRQQRCGGDALFTAP